MAGLDLRSSGQSLHGESFAHFDIKLGKVPDADQRYHSPEPIAATQQHIDL